MLRRLVQARLLQLELLTQGTRAFGEALEIVRPRFERRHHGVDFAYALLGTLDRRDRGRHELLDPRGFLGPRSKRSEALVRALHPRHQLPAALIELRAKVRKVGKTLVQVIDHATAPL